jgi:protein CpxP
MEDTMKKINLVLALLLLGSIALTAQRHFNCDDPDQNGRQAMHQRGERGERGEHGQQMGKHRQGMPLAGILSEVELTDAQKDQIHALQQKHQKWNIQNRADVETLQIDKREALKNKNFSLAKKLTNQISEKRNDAAIKRIELHEDVWNLLTKEQQDAAEDCMKKQPKRQMRNREDAPSSRDR